MWVRPKANVGKQLLKVLEKSHLTQWKYEKKSSNVGTVMFERGNVVGPQSSSTALTATNCWASPGNVGMGVICETEALCEWCVNDDEDGPPQVPTSVNPGQAAVTQRKPPVASPPKENRKCIGFS